MKKKEKRRLKGSFRYISYLPITTLKKASEKETKQLVNSFTLSIHTIMTGLAMLISTMLPLKVLQIVFTK